MQMDDSELDEEFPLGDGTADTSALVTCPYCGETVTIAVDPGGGSHQIYIQDCDVCCNPWEVSLRFVDGIASAEVRPSD
jgi:hypothetical protein